MTKQARKTTTKFTTKTKASRKAKSSVAGVPGKHSSKSASILTMLGRQNGTTVSEIAACTGWQNHSVRGFLSGTVKKKLGHEVASEIVDGERRYRITG
jgi:hypothetical protein